MSVTAAAGFRAAGVTAGLKPSGRPDVALVVNDGPEHVVAAVFTSNRVEAAPVTWSRQVVTDGRADVVLLNSGGANACTGAQGFLDTHRSAELAAEAVGVSAGDVVVCSTGLIGELLPMDKIESGITAAAGSLSADGGEDAATAIMTTIPTGTHQGAEPGLSAAAAARTMTIDAASTRAVDERRRSGSGSSTRTGSAGLCQTSVTVVPLPGPESTVASPPTRRNRSSTDIASPSRSRGTARRSKPGPSSPMVTSIP